ncbi:hypothetical protein [Mesorhizobium sp. SP-1A]|uniref:hypothetical protein n=1 Tax=Mesorhizobium sp. SP-1A TaxID=3077840 RepID=UPI0028F6CF83|nr:hypothetical protein [Mesorhizobium sp. SP-1A]
MLSRQGNKKPTLRLLPLEGEDTAEDIFQKIVLNATRANVASVWVRGRKVRTARQTN